MVAKRQLGTRLLPPTVPWRGVVTWPRWSHARFIAEDASADSAAVRRPAIDRGINVDIGISAIGVPSHACLRSPVSHGRAVALPRPHTRIRQPEDTHPTIAIDTVVVGEGAAPSSAKSHRRSRQLPIVRSKQYS